jgi:aspartate-semialdehyde dehydrogenase
MVNNGMSVVVGKVKRCDAFKYGVQLTLLVNNTILGAAGSAILNAEIFFQKSLFKRL